LFGKFYRNNKWFLKINFLLTSEILKQNKNKTQTKINTPNKNKRTTNNKNNSYYQKQETRIQDTKPQAKTITNNENTFNVVLVISVCSCVVFFVIECVLRCYCLVVVWCVVISSVFLCVSIVLVLCSCTLFFIVLKRSRTQNKEQQQTNDKHKKPEQRTAYQQQEHITWSKPTTQFRET
jgi:Flp pilus assembly protein TadB